MSSRKQVDRNASSVRVRLWMRDDAGDPVPSIAYDDAQLEIEVLAYDGTGFVDKKPSLSAGTVGSWGANHWSHINNGIHEYGLQDSLITAGEETIIRARYGATSKWRHLIVAATGFSELDMGQATPGGSTVGDQLDAIETDEGSQGIDVSQFTGQTNATAQWPDQTLLDGTDSIGDPMHRHARWQLAYRGLDLIPGGEVIGFTIKSASTDDDEDALLLVEYNVTSTVTTITRLNQGAQTDTVNAVGTYQVDTTDPTKMEFLLEVADNITTQIVEGTYVRGIKRIGVGDVLHQDTVVIGTSAIHALTV